MGQKIGQRMGQKKRGSRQKAEGEGSLRDEYFIMKKRRECAFGTLGLLLVTKIRRIRRR